MGGNEMSTMISRSHPRISTAALLSVLTAALFALCLSACSGPSARIRDPGEDSLVDSTRGGVVTYRSIIDSALKDLSKQYRLENKNVTTFNKLRVFFAGVDNSTSEELGSWRAQINGIIDNRINASGDFMDISYERFVKPALDELGIRRDSFGIPKHRRAFAQLMEQEGNPVDAVLYAKLTQGNSRAGNLKQSDYILFFELLNLKDGTRLLAQGEISKEYTR
jgi:hypothetical protein